MKLVFVHGAGESSMSFHYQLRHFRGAIGIDLPGHPVGKPCTSVEGYVEWVRGYLAGRRCNDVVLCGHSMGGAIAQTYALNYPDELKGIVLVGTGARLRVAPKYLKASEDGIRDPAPWLQARRESYRNIEPGVREKLLERSAQNGAAIQLNDYQCCDKFDLMREVENISLPTHAICGTADAMTPPRYTSYLVENIPGAQNTVVDGASHWVQLEKHREVNRAIETFVATLG